ncbi:MAG: DUF1833 family protein [Rhizomicrobium sp.]
MSSAGYTYTDEAREYMFSPAGADVIYDAIELRHPAFVDGDGNPIAVRFVNAPFDLAATLEEGAPLNGGETVTFAASRFDLVKPDSPETGLPQAQIAVANVMREVSPWLSLAVSSVAPVELSLRQFLADDLTEPCFVMHGLTFDNATSNIRRVTATCGFGDLLNMPCPVDRYTVENSPGLNRS